MKLLLDSLKATLQGIGLICLIFIRIVLAFLPSLIAGFVEHHVPTCVVAGIALINFPWLGFLSCCYERIGAEGKVCH